jgi:hypothetical protein
MQIYSILKKSQILLDFSLTLHQKTPLWYQKIQLSALLQLSRTKSRPLYLVILQ